MISIYRYSLILLTTFFTLGCNETTQQTNSTNVNEEMTPDSKASENNTVKQRILFFGNSLTAGYGLDNENDAFPALIQAKIDSLDLPYECVNAGLSGETSAGGKERIDWLLKSPIDIFVLELGANDGLRGIPLSSTYENLSAIIQKVQKAYPDCKLVLAGMMIPPSMGQDYFEDFRAIFPKLAKEYNMTLIPFLLDSVAGIKELNQGDGVHPTKEGQIILANNVWTSLAPLLMD